MPSNSLLSTILTNTIGAVVSEAIGRAAQKPEVPLDPAQAPFVAADVAPEVVDALRNDPRIKDLEQRVEHLTSTEAWYSSRANWSAIVAGLTPLAAIAGYNLAPEDQIAIAALLGFVGNTIAAYLARRARTASKPLGA